MFRVLPILALLLCPLACSSSPPVPAPGGYEYVPDPDAWVMVTYGKFRAIGKLDAAGNFRPDPHWVDVGLGPLSGGVPPARAINSPAGPAYEYRSGRLIPGELDRDGNFIPDLGGEVIAFKDYHPGKGVPRIYNLPGRLVKKGSKGEEQK